jgi:hypothetical protein
MAGMMNNMGGLGGIMNMMMSGGMAEMFNQPPNTGMNSSGPKQSEVDKMKDSIEAKIEAQARLELSRLALPAENSGPQVQLLDDDSKTEQKLGSSK